LEMYRVHFGLQFYRLPYIAEKLSQYFNLNRSNG
jgi:hypothetical protein